MAQEQSDSLIEQWRAGVPLSVAWLAFADPYTAGKLRATDTHGAFETQRILMVAELWANLGSCELIAFGKCVKPVVSDGPIIIPCHTFAHRPPSGIGDSDDFEISGWRYESVTIVQRAESAIARASTIARPVQKRGPKSIAPLIVAALERLRNDDLLFDGRSQAKRIEAVRDEVSRQNPARFPRNALPGYTTVWTYLTGRKPLE